MRRCWAKHLQSQCRAKYHGEKADKQADKHYMFAHKVSWSPSAVTEPQSYT